MRADFKKAEFAPVRKRLVSRLCNLIGTLLACTIIPLATLGRHQIALSYLLLRPGALGDALLTLPALHALRFANAGRIALLGTPASWRFLNHRLGKIELEVLDAGDAAWLGLYAPGATLSPRAGKVLAATHKAAVFLAGDTADTVTTLKAAGVAEVLAITAPRLNDRASDPVPAHGHHGPPEPCHAARRLLDPLEPMVGTEAIVRALCTCTWDQGTDPLLAVSADETHAALARLKLPAPPTGGWLALHPGSGGRTKCWPAERFAALAAHAHARHGLEPLVCFGPADDAVRKAFEIALPAGLPWYCAANFPLRELTALLVLARAFVGNDAGVSHLAARCCPTLALFGPTDPRVWRPLGPRVAVLNAPTVEMSSLVLETVQEALAAMV